MSSEADTRILNMQINNKEFLKGSADSLKAVNTLNKGINDATKGGGLQPMAGSVDTVRTKFGALQVAAVTALGTITNRVVNAGINLAKGLALDPIIDGFHEYEKVLTSTQTIVANTGVSTKTAGKYLKELNNYSDLTIYNFGQMADNIGKFTAAGVKLPDATVAIKGLANAAALAGASTEDLNRAMYQTSQALSTGFIKLIDFKSLEQANLGTKNFRDTLVETARVFQKNGDDVDASISKYGNFRDSLRDGWLTTDIFTKSMKIFAGASDLAKKSTQELTNLGYKPQAIAQIHMGKTVAFSVKELKKMGYTAPGVAENLNRLSQGAIDSATKIKTFSQLIDVVKEALGSGWASIFQQLMGDLEQSGKLWTKVGNTITGAMAIGFQAVTDFLGVWLKTKDKNGLTGFEQAWGSIGNIFKVIGNILKPFMILLNAISPGTSNAGNAAYGATHAFYLFTEALVKISNITKFIAPAFAFVGKAIGFLITKVKELIGWFGQFENSFGSIGPSLERFADAIKSAFKLLLSGDFSGFADGISSAFSALGKEGAWIADNLIGGLLKGLNSSSILGAIKKLVDDFVNYFKNLLGIHSPSLVFEGFGQNIVQGLTNGITANSGGILSAIGNFVSSIGEKFKSIDKFDIANIFSVIFSAATIGIIYKFMRALGDGLNVVRSIEQNIFGKQGLLANANKTLEAIQTNLKAKALLYIAIAVGILALSLFLLSKIPYPQLAKGLLAISGLLIMINNTFAQLGKSAVTTKTGIASVIAMGAAMIFMATAVLILSAAVLAFGSMDIGTLIKGMIFAGIALAALVAASLALSTVGPYLILAGAAMVLMSTSLLILAAALTALLGVAILFSKVSSSTLASGLLKMGASLLLIGIAIAPLALMSPGVLVAAVALGILAASLVAMLGTITLFSAVDWGTLIDGVAKIGAALILIGLAAIIAAPGLLALGVAFGLIGLGLLAAGIGMTLLGAGIAVVAAAGTAAAAVLFTAVESFLSLLPVMGIQFIAALDTILQALADKSPSIVNSLVTIAGEILRGFGELAPKIGNTAVKILGAFLDALLKSRDKIYNFAADMIIGFLDILEKKVPIVVKKGVRIAIAFLQGLGSNAKKLVDTAGKTILDFLNALDAAVVKYTPEIVRVGLQIGQHVASGVINGIVDSLPGPLKSALKALGIGGNEKGSKVGENAKGTDFWRGGLSLVGEAGPELVSMNRGSAVITNKNLVGFMRAVSALSHALVSGTAKTKNSPGGAINYVVSADFKGDPKRDGVAYAANIMAGLMNGLKSNQNSLNGTMSNVAGDMSQAFADILGIQSPSKVFQKYGDYVAQGFIKGLLASTDRVAKAAKKLGETAIDAISRTISDGQTKLEVVRGEAEGYAKAIEELQKIADDEDLSEKKKAKIDKEIEKLQERADAAQAAADKQAALVDEQNAAAERQIEFDKADTQGKADMRKEDAATAASKASEARELALSYQKEADLIRKYDKKKAAALDKYAKTALDRAKRYSDDANEYAKEAYDYAQKVQMEIDAQMAKQLQSVSAQDVSNAQAAFDAYTKSLADAQNAAIRDDGPKQITFEQNNYSPEALSPTEIYRNGKTLLSMTERLLVDTP